MIKQIINKFSQTQVKLHVGSVTLCKAGFKIYNIIQLSFGISKYNVLHTIDTCINSMIFDIRK